MDTPKFPFDEGNAPAGKDAEQGTPSSATGMFATPPLKGSEPVPSVLDSLTPTPATPGNAAAAPTTKPFSAPSSRAPEPESAPGEFTQMYRAMPFSPVSAPSGAETPKAPEAAPTHGPLAPQPRKQPPGDFTRVFTQLPTPQAVPKVPPPAPQSAAQTPAPQPQGSTAPANVPGEFTQMFQGLGGSTEASTPAPPAVPASLAADSARTDPAPPSESPKAAGSFTQLFQSISAPTPEPFKQKEETTPASKPDSFTSVFRSSQAKPAQEPFAQPSAGKDVEDFWSNVSSAPRSPTNSAPPPPPTSQGGFTQLFETLSEDRPTSQPFAAQNPIVRFATANPSRTCATSDAVRTRRFHATDAITGRAR